jgi:hypothetical protein
LFTTTEVPTQEDIERGVMLAEGQSLKVSDYQELFFVIGYKYTRTQKAVLVLSPFKKAVNKLTGLTVFKPKFKNIDLESFDPDFFSLPDLRCKIPGFIEAAGQTLDRDSFPALHSSIGLSVVPRGAYKPKWQRKK